MSTFSKVFKTFSEKNIIYVINLLPVFGVIIPFIGLCKALVFYKCFNLNIVDYISFSEIVTLFLSDFFQIATTFVIIALYFLNRKSYFDTPKRLLLSKENNAFKLEADLGIDNNIQVVMEVKGPFSRKIIDLISQDDFDGCKEIEWQNVPEEVEAYYYLNMRSKLLRKSLLGLLEIIVYGGILYLFNSTNKFAVRELIFLIILIIITAILFYLIEFALRLTESNYKSVMVFSIACLSLFFQLSYSIFNAMSIKYGGAMFYKAELFLDNNIKLQTNVDTVYLGRTSSYIFSYVKNEDRVLNVNSSKVVTMTLKDLNNSIAFTPIRLFHDMKEKMKTK